VALGISLILVGLIGIIYGIVKKNKTTVVASIILLIIIAIIWKIYSYLYSLTPY
jgi:uncharacterized membrane protein